MPPRERCCELLFLEDQPSSFLLNNNNDNKEQRSISRSSNNNMRKTKKSVHFTLNGPMIHPVENLGDKCCAGSLWYEKKDYKIFKEWSKKTVEFMDQAEIGFGDESRHLCGRGLEKHTRYQSQLHMERRCALNSEICYLRALGGGVGACDPEDLAMLFQSMTAPSVQEARVLGQEDARVARIIHLMDQGLTKRKSSTTSRTTAAAQSVLQAAVATPHPPPAAARARYFTSTAPGTATATATGTATASNSRDNYNTHPATTTVGNHFGVMNRRRQVRAMLRQEAARRLIGG